MDTPLSGCYKAGFQACLGEFFRCTLAQQREKRWGVGGSKTVMMTLLRVV